MSIDVSQNSVGQGVLGQTRVPVGFAFLLLHCFTLAIQVMHPTVKQQLASRDASCYFTVGCQSIATPCFLDLCWQPVKLGRICHAVQFVRLVHMTLLDALQC